jgi:hypothetical protein
MSRSVPTLKYSSRQGNRIERFIPHHTAGGSNLGNLAGLSTGTRKVSSSYVLFTTGELVGVVPEEFRPWTTGWEADKGAVTVETVNSGGAPEWRINDVQLEILVKLAADLARRYGWGSLDRATRLKGHREYVATLCPGPYLWDRFDHIVQEGNKLLLPTPLEEDEMKPLNPPVRTVDSRIGQGITRLRANVPVRVPVAYAQQAFLHVTAVQPNGVANRSGFLSVSSSQSFGTSLINWQAGDSVNHDGAPFACPEGHVWMLSTTDVDILVDVMAQ